MSPAKHGRHIGIMSPSSCALSYFWFLIDNLKGCINFIQTLQRVQTSLTTGQVLKGVIPQNFDLSYGPFFYIFLDKLWKLLTFSPAYSYHFTCEKIPCMWGNSLQAIS